MIKATRGVVWRRKFKQQTACAAALRREYTPTPRGLPYDNLKEGWSLTIEITSHGVAYYNLK